MSNEQTMTALDQASAAMTPGQAMREVLERYEVLASGSLKGAWGAYHVDDWTEDFTGTRAECQAWIDDRAAEAAFAAALPVNDDLLAAGMDSPIVYVRGTCQPERDETSRNIIAATLAYLAGLPTPPAVKGEG